VTQPLTVWLVCDGKPGHENQSTGLAEAVARRVPCGIHRISLAGKRGLIGRVRAAVAGSAGFPKPDLILAAGHATHPALLWLARKHAAKSIVLMRPSLPLGCFDLCIAPDHDFPDGCARENVILTRGALNRVTPGTGEKTGKLILIGGPSKTHGWDGATIIDMLSQCTDRGGWELTDSRRTPEGFLDEVRTRLPGVTVFPHQQTPPDWVPGKLQHAKEVWVTEDSVSMIYEALTSGARVGLLPVPRLKTDSRVLKGLDSLVTESFLTPFPAWLGTQRLQTPPTPAREADRCADVLIRRLTSVSGDALCDHHQTPPDRA
jgi:mitochondrial fission protein ELM1